MGETKPIDVVVQPEAAALASALGVRAALDKLVKHAQDTIPGLRSLRVGFEAAFDTGEDRIVIEAIRDPGIATSWTWRDYSKWTHAMFSPDISRHFVLLDTFDVNHAR
ncbi:MAG: hypothetical protein L0Y70_27990 [Gemmataceae bacterium]|nr:hypothetical protein [Gemmataceae bacterium]